MGISGTQSWLSDARAGLERAGESRAGGISVYNLICTINGVDVSDVVIFDNPGPKVGLRINDQPNTCTLTLKYTTTVTPKVGHPLTLAIGSSGREPFSGNIVNVVRRIEKTQVGVITMWDVTATDQGSRLEQRIINATYTSQSATFIAQDLIQNYTIGLRTDAIAPDLPTIDSFVVQNETAGSALRRLCNDIDAAFTVDQRGIVHLFQLSAGDQSHRRGTNPETIIDSRWSLRNGLSYTTDGTQRRTRVIVDGYSTSTPVGAPTGRVFDLRVDWQVLGGGGGGGENGGVGGGGGGGYPLQGTETSLDVGSYAIVVGLGGTGGGSPSNGGDSSFNGHTSPGGGAGAPGSGSSPTDGSAGACGGGGSGGSSTLGASSGGAGSLGGHGGEGEDSGSGGGGGAAGDGGNAASAGGGAGAGGTGLSSSISGSPVVYGGGGGGNGASHSGGGGAGGGGNGGAGGNPGTPGTDGLGGGGGGGGYDGGDGVVIISYVSSSLTATGGTISMSGGRTIHTFTANDTFTVSAITVDSVNPIQTVTDLPLDDGTQIDAQPGTVLIGNQVFSYLGVTGPSVSGENAPGTTITADANPGDVTLDVSDDTIFTTAPGWAKVGDQVIRFSAVGAGSLTIPATGFGALASTVTSGTQITYLSTLVLSLTGVSFDTTLPQGSTVTQRVIKDDPVAQAVIAALEGNGSDGVIEHYVSGDYSITAATSRANAELTDFSAELPDMQWSTTDLNAMPGRSQAVALGDLAITLTITEVDLEWERPDALPLRHCTASLAHALALLDAIAAGAPA